MLHKPNAGLSADLIMESGLGCTLFWSRKIHRLKCHWWFSDKLQKSPMVSVKIIGCIRITPRAACGRYWTSWMAYSIAVAGTWFYTGNTMKHNRSRIARIGLTLAMCLSARLTQAQPATGQPAARSWSNDPRVLSRTYIFTNTGETLPYAVFVSTKVAKDKPAPLIVALRGAGGNPGVFMHEPALTLAEDGCYIIAAPMGYSAMANFGNPAGGMGGFGRRGGATTNAAPPMQGTNQPARGPQPGRENEVAEHCTRIQGSARQGSRRDHHGRHDECVPILRPARQALTPVKASV